MKALIQNAAADIALKYCFIISNQYVPGMVKTRQDMPCHATGCDDVVVVGVCYKQTILKYIFEVMFPALLLQLD